MESILPGDEGAAPHRGQLNRAVKESTWSALTSSPGTARSARAPWPVAPDCTPPP